MFIPYASMFLAMLLGEELMKDTGVSLATLNHTNLATVQAHFATHSEALYHTAVSRLDAGLGKLLGETYPSGLTWQRIAGAFRRGDLLIQLEKQ